MRHIYVNGPIYSQLLEVAPNALRAAHDMQRADMVSLSGACMTVMVGESNIPLALNLCTRHPKDIPIRDIMTCANYVLDKHPNLEIPVFFRIGAWQYQHDLELDVTGTGRRNPPCD